ncbi:hydrogenase maturation protein HypF [Mariprofundus ferrinatatus]|uniref:Hydrogenase maturation protein HypF n=1 Tax=Mariprofundus ferrinatatus TaxID=1921087 RepID=A0A2K8L383_9PROT|nr:carbamoyltransferase HypF [Mariprofundus ferrinatatus]ATX81737.1 hydrogenase maturation protein HypF [Mariprofundus ferrinatatus]
MPEQFPIQIDLPPGFDKAPAILALGGELKSSICLIDAGRAWITETMGDLEQEFVYRNFIDQIDELFETTPPAHLVIDKHPDYLSSQWGERLAVKYGLTLHSVQHHYAHIAAVMADNALPVDTKPLLGFALDGLGFGDDGTIWGGEILLADYRRFQRLACFQPVAMIGGAAAAVVPWRNTLAHLLPIWEQVHTQFADVDIVQFLKSKPVETFQTMVNKGMNAPPASSCGRLFDAVAGGLGINREGVAFEAEAAINLERLAATCFEQVCEPYAYRIDRDDCMHINWQPMWLELLADIRSGVEPEAIASRFHHTLIDALTKVAQAINENHDFNRIALSGGVFQNRLLSTYLPRSLESCGFEVLQHRQVPVHDGGLSLGQAIIAAAR